MYIYTYILKFCHPFFELMLSTSPTLFYSVSSSINLAPNFLSQHLQLQILHKISISRNIKLIHDILYLDLSVVKIPMRLRLTLYLVGKKHACVFTLVVNKAPFQWTDPNSSTSNPWLHACICCQTIHLPKPAGPVSQVSKVA